MSDETAGCGPQPDPYPAEGLILNVGGPGAILVLEFDHSVGCCPELDVSPELDFAAATLTVTYTLSNDMCDCICDIDLGYTISGIPAGNWTLVLPNGVNRAFTVL